MSEPQNVAATPNQIILFDWKTFKLIVAEWLLYVSGRWVIIGSGNGLSPVRHQAINYTDTEI